MSELAIARKIVPQARLIFVMNAVPEKGGVPAGVTGADAVQVIVVIVLFLAVCAALLPFVFCCILCTDAAFSKTVRETLPLGKVG